MYNVILPGLEISAQALWQQAAKLPEIEIVKPSSILAKNTDTSMRAGVVYGYIGSTEYIISKMKEEIGRDDIKVYATGELKGQFTVEANHFTLDAIKAIGDADGDSIMIR